MSINEDELLQAGFTPEDVQKLKNPIANYSSTLESVVDGLANRFTASILITLGAAVVFIMALLLGSRVHVISGGVGILFALLIVWLMIPKKLAYKAWRFKKNNVIP
jgi:membrane protein YdbS with pleckstrin-like domain